MIVCAVSIGVVVGLALGVLGGGGAVLAVPGMVYGLGETPRAAITGSLVVVGVTAVAALISHARAGHLRVGYALAFAAIGAGGTVVGSRIGARIPDPLLLLAFAALMAVMAIVMLSRGAQATTRGAAGEPAAVLTVHPFTCACERVARIVLAAAAVGLLTGALGVGGGFLIVPTLVLWLKFGMPAATGTSLLVIALNSATALITRAREGTLQLEASSWPAVALVTATALLAASVGGRISGRLDPRMLGRAFAISMLVVAAFTGVQATLDVA